jgi:hypothetical protein
MAYAFDKIMSQMDNKIDVFGQPQQGGQNQGQVQSQSSGGSTPKTSTEGELGSGGGSSGPSGGASATVSPQAGTQSSQLAFQAAQSQPQSNFKPFRDIGDKIKANETALQEEADRYVAGEKAKQSYSVGTADIDKAVGGDADTSAKVGGLVSRKTIDPYADYKQTDPYVADVEKFKSEPGLTGYFRSQYGPTYSRGQASFDIGRLQSDPNFYTNLRGLEGKQQDVLKKAAEFYDPEKGVQATVRKYGEEQLSAAQQAAKDYLNKLRGGIETTNQGELEAFNKKIEQLRNDPNVRAEAVRAGMADPGIQTGLQQAIAANPELGKYLTPQAIAAFGLNPADFAKIDDKTYTAENFYDQDEANRFNRIQTMLGVGGTAKMAGLAPGAAATANDAANAAAKARIKEIMDNAAARKAQGAERAGSINYNDIKNRSREALVGKYSREGRDLAGLQGVDIDKYFQGLPLDGLNDEDFIDATQANDLNSAYEELMDPRRMNAGRFAEGYNPANYTFDQVGYERALNAIGMAPPPAPPTFQASPMSEASGYREISPTKTLNEAGNFYKDVAMAPVTIAQAANEGAKKLTKSASRIVGRRR